MNNKRWLVWLGIAVAFLVFLYLIRSILLPFVLGALVAYFLDPAADRLQKAGIGRGSATSLITVAFFVVVGALLVLALPLLADQLVRLMATLPSYVNDIERDYLPKLTHWLGDLPQNYMEGFKNAAANVSGVMIGFITNFIGGIFQSGMAFVNFFSLILITPVVTFYLLRDWDGITDSLGKLLPRPHERTIREQLLIIDATLSGFIRGQLNVCLLMGLYYAAGLTLVGVNFGVVIGLATGLLAIIPYVGFFFGMSAGLGIAFFQFGAGGALAATLGVYLFGQLLESYFLTPKLVGEKVGLHPVWIIFGMLSGAALFGFVGVLLAIPLTAVIGVLIRFAAARYLQSSWYKG